MITAFGFLAFANSIHGEEWWTLIWGLASPLAFIGLETDLVNSDFSFWIAGGLGFLMWSVLLTLVFSSRIGESFLSSSAEIFAFGSSRDDKNEK